MLVLSTMIALTVSAGLNAMESDRPQIYQMLDAVMTPRRVGPPTVKWPAAFAILDSMKGMINVNTYRTLDIYGSPDNYTLLRCAIYANNFLATKKLIEEYGADPNLFIGDQWSPLDYALEVNIAEDNDSIIKLLLAHGARLHPHSMYGKELLKNFIKYKK